MLNFSGFIFQRVLGMDFYAVSLQFRISVFLGFFLYFVIITPCLSICLYIHTHVYKHLSAFRHRQMYTYLNFQLLQVSYILTEGADMLQSMCSFPSLSPCLKYYCFLLLVHCFEICKALI